MECCFTISDRHRQDMDTLTVEQDVEESLIKSASSCFNRVLSQLLHMKGHVRKIVRSRNVPWDSALSLEQHSRRYTEPAQWPHTVHVVRTGHKLQLLTPFVIKALVRSGKSINQIFCEGFITAFYPVGARIFRVLKVTLLKLCQ